MGYKEALNVKVVPGVVDITINQKGFLPYKERVNISPSDSRIIEISPSRVALDIDDIPTKSVTKR